MTRPPADVDVLVVGAGPVGVTLAMDLARLGVDVAVVERRDDIPPNPRCNTTNARSMEIFRRLGCADAVRAAGLPGDHSTDVVYMTSLNGHELTRYVRSTPDEVRAGHQHGVASNWPTPEPQHFISQIYLEPVLRRHATGHYGVPLSTGWELTGFDQDATGVAARLRHVDTGTEHDVRTRYLVGTDGSGSLVRATIGARLTGVPRIGDSCSTLFRSQRVAELAAAAPGWMWRFASGGVLVAIDGHDHFLIHNGIPPGADPETHDPEAQMFAAVGEPFDYEIVNRARWTSRAMVASRFRRGRVFLAGDAAHLWIPMGGFGMNAGIADATSLSWRLSGVLAGWADDAILDTYETERAPLGSTVAGQAVAWGAVVRDAMSTAPSDLRTLDDDPDARATLGRTISKETLSEFECPGFQLGYRYVDSPIIVDDAHRPPPPFTVTEYVPSTAPGCRLPHFHHDDRSVYDRLSEGFTVLTSDVQSGATDLHDALHDLGAPVSLLTISTDDAAEHLDDMQLVVVRPDQHIAWRSPRPIDRDTARHVAAQITGRLIAPPAPQHREARRVSVVRASGPIRWFDGALACIDTAAERVIRLEIEGSPSAVIQEASHRPRGLAVGTNGNLVVSCEDHHLCRISHSTHEVIDVPTEVAAALGPLSLATDATAYVVTHHRDDGTHQILHLAGGQVTVEATSTRPLRSPTVSSDGQMLRWWSDLDGFVQARIDPAGHLGAVRPFAENTDLTPIADAIDDGANGVWACEPAAQRVLHLDDAGRTIAEVPCTGGRPVSCTLDTKQAALLVLVIAGEAGRATELWSVDLTRSE